jgi:hypothetical protein
VEFDTVDTYSAREVSRECERAFGQVTNEMGYSPEDRIRAVLCSSRASFERMTGGAFPEWGAAFAIPSENLIILKSPRLVKGNTDFPEVVTHEVTHVIVHDFVGGKAIPRWLDEGFAMYESKEWKTDNSLVVGWASVSNALEDLGDLEGGFPDSERWAALAYAESFLAVAYLKQEYGKQGLLRVFRELRESGDMDRAMKRAGSFGYASFKREWMVYTKNRFSVAAFTLAPGSIWTATILIFLVVFVARYRRNRRRLTAMKEHEAILEEVEYSPPDEEEKTE